VVWVEADELVPTTYRTPEGDANYITVTYGRIQRNTTGTGALKERPRRRKTYAHTETPQLTICSSALGIPRSFDRDIRVGMPLEHSRKTKNQGANSKLKCFQMSLWISPTCGLVENG